LGLATIIYWLRFETSLFVASYDSQAYGGGIRSRLHTGSELYSESGSYVTTDGQPASLSWNKTPFWGLRPDLYYRLTVAGLLIWGALSDERTGLSFTIAVVPPRTFNCHSPVVTGMSLVIFVAAGTRASEPLPRNCTSTSVRCYSGFQAVFTEPLPSKWSYSSKYLLRRCRPSTKVFRN
jgi:hypothetical protein